MIKLKEIESYINLFIRCDLTNKITRDVYGPIPDRKQEAKGRYRRIITQTIKSVPQLRSASASGRGLNMDIEGSPGNILVEPTPESPQHAPIEPYSPRLVHDPLLSEYNLAVNEKYRLFVCTLCQEAVTLKSLANHLRRTEGFRLSDGVLKEIEGIGLKHHVLSAYPNLSQTSPIEAIDGLKVSYKAGCPLCMYTASGKKVREHIARRHPEISGKEAPLSNVPCQMLNQGAAHSDIRILPPSDPIHMLSLEDSVIQDFEAHTPYTDDTLQPPTDSRLITPWILRTGFHNYTRGRDASKLRSLIDLPQPRETSTSHIRKLVGDYLQEATALIPNTDYFVRQKLNTFEPESGLNHTPLHVHHQHATTVENYAIPITRLVSALIRGGFDDFHLPTSPDVQAALQSLQSSPTTDHLHSLFLSLWTRVWNPSKEDAFPDPTICFLALSTVRADGTFSPAKDVTGIIAKLTRAIQLTILRQMHNLVALGEVRDLANAYERFEPFLIETQPSSFQTLRFFQHFATSIAMQTISLPRIIWPDREAGDFSHMLYMGQKISLQQLKHLIGTLEEKIRRIWEQEVLLGLDLHVPVGVPADNLRLSERNYSFINDPKNDFDKYKHALGAQIFRHPMLKNQFFRTIDTTKEVVYNIPGIRKWLRSLAQVEALLLLSIEMKSGAPVRMTELASTLACNIDTRTRNLYAIGRNIVIVSQYTKNTNNEQMDRVIPHALAAFDADMLVQIHAIARPLASFLAPHAFPSDPSVARMYLERLFMDLGEPFTTAVISKLMAEESLLIILWAMTISDYRQLAVGFRNAICLPSDIDEEDGKIMRVIHAQQSGHSLATEKRIYGLSPDLVEGISEITINLYINSSKEWQVRLGIVPSGLSLTYKEASMPNFPRLVREGAINLFPNRREPSAQPENSELVPFLRQLVSNQSQFHQELLEKITFLEEKINAFDSGNHPLATTTTPHPTVPTSCSSSRPLASNTPPNLPTPSHLAPTGSGSTSAGPFSTAPLKPLTPSYHEISLLKRKLNTPVGEPSIHETILQPHAKRPRIHLDFHHPGDMVDVLRGLYGPTATWSDWGQRQGVEASMLLERDLVVILRTGVGKTAIAVLPPLVEDGFTVVVIPLVAVIEDWKRRLQAMNIPYDEFDSSRPNTCLTGTAKLILVSSDKSRYPTFTAALAKLSQLKPILRFIFEEAHLYYTDCDFRSEALGSPCAVRTFAAQVVLLSATIPPAAEAFMKKAFGMTNPLIIRGLSHRRELKYVCQRGFRGLGDMVGAFRRYLKDLQDLVGWTSKDRWIVFVANLEDGEEVASLLNVEFYRAEKKEKKSQSTLGKNDKREGVYSRWLDGDTVGLVASPALGAGAPFDLVSFVQQSARAGRDGEPAHCLIFTSASKGKRLVSGMEEMRGVNEIPKLIDGEVCIRHAIGHFMDGVAFECRDFEPGWQVCSSCERTHEESGEEIAYTGSAMTHFPTRSSYPPLPPPQVLSPEATRQKLDRAFARSVTIGRKAAAEALLEKKSITKPYEDVLAIVGRFCGLCFTKQVYQDHAIEQCSGIDISKFRDIFSNIAYKDKVYSFRPCYWCHICSFGSDLLHKTFVRGTKGKQCDYPNFLKPLIYHIWYNPVLRKSVEEFFGVSWSDDLTKYIEWLVEPNEDHSTAAMALVIWFGETREEDEEGSGGRSGMKAPPHIQTPPQPNASALASLSRCRTRTPRTMSNAEAVARSLCKNVYHCSRDAIFIDDTVVVSLFASLDPDRPSAHVPQTLGVNFEPTGQAMAQLYEAFEDQKRHFNIHDPRSLLATASSIRNKLVRDRDQPFFRGLSPQALDVLKWCIAAHALTINPESLIRLGRIKKGPHHPTGFSLIAQRRIAKGSTIWESLGMCPSDNDTPHSSLSCITTAIGQDQEPGSERVLYGPLRMMNHRCKSFNAEYAYIRGTSAFVAEALHDIEPGVEDVSISWRITGRHSLVVEYRPKLSAEQEIERSGAEDGRENEEDLDIPDNLNREIAGPAEVTWSQVRLVSLKVKEDQDAQGGQLDEVAITSFNDTSVEDALTDDDLEDDVDESSQAPIVPKRKSKLKRKRGQKSEKRRQHKRKAPLPGLTIAQTRQKKVVQGLLMRTVFYKADRFSLNTHARVTSTGWHGLPPPKAELRDIVRRYRDGSISEQLSQFQQIPFDPASKSPTALIDSMDRPFGIRTTSATFLAKMEQELYQAMYTLMNPTLNDTRVQNRSKGNSRGNHLQALMGHQRPYHDTIILVRWHQDNRKAVEEFLNTACIQELIAWINWLLHAFFPSIALRYQRCADWHHSKYGVRPLFGLFWNFCINGIFPDQTRVHTDPHADPKNVVGVCIIFVYVKPGFGFDHSTRSWLVIYEAGIIIELPPNVAFFYPSSLFIHFNYDVSNLHIIHTIDGSRPSLSSCRHSKDKNFIGPDLPEDAHGRGSIVFFSQGNLFSSSETGFATLGAARRAGHHGTTDIDENFNKYYAPYGSFEPLNSK
ncbi:hypothetical protein MD484_g8699, partial [Candolleomyces efflorescens]